MFGLVSVAWNALAAILFVLLPRKIGEPIGQFVAMAGFRYIVAVMKACRVIECDLSALDALRDAGPMVIAPNHPSLLDVVLITSRLPHVVCIAKPGIWSNIFLGGGARLAGYIRNDSPIRLVKQAAGQVRAGSHLLIFPEGTRTADGPVGDLRGGFALVAKVAGVPVQTVLIDSNSPFLRKGWPIFRKPDGPVTYRVRLGRRFEIGQDIRVLVGDLGRYYGRELAGEKRFPLGSAD